LYKIDSEDFKKALAIGHPFDILIVDPDIMDRTILVEGLTPVDHQYHVLGREEDAAGYKKKDQDGGKTIGSIHGKRKTAQEMKIYCRIGLFNEIPGSDVF